MWAYRHTGIRTNQGYYVLIEWGFQIVDGQPASDCRAKRRRIMIEQPEATVAAILKMVEQVRKGKVIIIYLFRLRDF